MKVSVLMPVFNGGEYLADALQSVLTQEYQNIEVILSDDGSTDNSVEIATNILSNDKNSHRIIRNMHCGKVIALNRAFELATGDAFCILAHDDVLENESIKERVTLLQKGNDFAFHNGKICDEKLNSIGSFFYNTPRWIYNKSNALKKSCRSNLVSGGLLILKRELAKRIFPLPDSLTFEDWWISFWGIFYSSSIGYSEKCLFKYRNHGHNDCGSPHFSKSMADFYKNDWERHGMFYAELIRKMREIKEDELAERLLLNARYADKALKGDISIKDLKYMSIIGVKKTLIGFLLSGFMNDMLEKFFVKYLRFKRWSSRMNKV